VAKAPFYRGRREAEQAGIAGGDGDWHTINGAVTRVMEGDEMWLS
jgi:hypothetical protein